MPPALVWATGMNRMRLASCAMGTPTTEIIRLIVQVTRTAAVQVYGRFHTTYLALSDTNGNSSRPTAFSPAAANVRYLQCGTPYANATSRNSPNVINARDITDAIPLNDGPAVSVLISIMH